MWVLWRKQILSLKASWKRSSQEDWVALGTLPLSEFHPYALLTLRLVRDVGSGVLKRGYIAFIHSPKKSMRSTVPRSFLRSLIHLIRKGHHTKLVFSALMAQAGLEKLFCLRKVMGFNSIFFWHFYWMGCLYSAGHQVYYGHSLIWGNYFLRGAWWLTGCDPPFRREQIRHESEPVLKPTSRVSRAGLDFYCLVFQVKVLLRNMKCNQILQGTHCSCSISRASDQWEKWGVEINREDRELSRQPGSKENRVK